MSKINIPLIIGIFYIGMFVGAVTVMVGEVTEGGIPCTWYDVLKIGFIVAFPFIVGWMAKTEHNRRGGSNANKTNLSKL